MKNKYIKNMCAVAVALTVTATSFAGESTKALKPGSLGFSEKASELISGKLSVDVVNAYVFRGVLQDKNMAVQPTLTLGAPVELGLGLDASMVKFTTMQSFHQSAPVEGWMRSNVDLGISLTKGDFTVTPSYQFFNSPNASFTAGQGINVRVDYADKGLFGLPALNPYANAFFTTSGRVGNGPRGGNYYEVGIAPSTKVGATTVSLPVALGLGSRGYYASNDNYGYTSVGLQSLTPLAERVDLRAGVTYTNSSNGINGPSNQNIWTTSVGLGVSF